MVTQSEATLERTARPESASPANGDGAHELEEHFRARPPRLDWEQLIENGATPALVLGAERRLHGGR